MCTKMSEVNLSAFIYRMFHDSIASQDLNYIYMPYNVERPRGDLIE